MEDLTSLLSEKSNIRGSVADAQMQIAVMRKSGFGDQADILEKSLLRDITNKDQNVLRTLAQVNQLYSTALKKIKPEEETAPKATSGYPDFDSARIGIESMLAMYGDLNVTIPASLVQESANALQSNDLNYANIVASSIDEIGGKLLDKKLEERPTTREDKEAVIRKAQAAYNRSDDEEAVVLLNSANIKGAFGGLVVHDDLPTMFGERDASEPEPSKAEPETSAPEKIKVGDIEYTRPDGFSDEQWREYTKDVESKSQTK